MDKRIFQRTVCLVTIWIFLLSQLAYASLYEDILSLPSSQNMPSWEGSSDWKNSKVGPVYKLKLEYPQIEPTLPPPDDGEGDSEPTGIWGWLVRNIGRPVKEHMIEPVVNFFTACRPAPPQRPILFELPAKLGEYDRLDVSVDIVELFDVESFSAPLVIRTPNYSVPLWLYDLQMSEELKTYLKAEKIQGQETSYLIIHGAYFILNEPGGYPLVLADGDIELKGKKG